MYPPNRPAERSAMLTTPRCHPYRPMPATIASRRWEDLPRAGWRAVLDDRAIGGLAEDRGLPAEPLHRIRMRVV